MPFIRGRYHVNPIAGAALEAAREADDALASQQQAEHGDGAGAADKSNGNANTSAAQGPIRRVEIETAEVVPSHSGRGQRGFVARIHRAGSTAADSSNGEQDFFGTPEPNASGGSSNAGGGDSAAAPETHVFSDHQDLTDFLHKAFEKDRSR
ncbi:MAG TPA: hypothetical protein VKS44_17030 [Candidatus Acidoferrales bacterium]|nr:hypothetical protein [Candidatus Acidoferrales bacterium]